MDVIRSVGRVRDPSALTPLVAFARDGDHAMPERLEAVNAIGNLNGPEKVNALVGLLGLRSPRDRPLVERVAETLGRVGDALAIPALRRSRQATRSASSRRAIDQAIEQIQERAAGGGNQHSPLQLPPMPE
jgi:HEAT repeat protein